MHQFQRQCNACLYTIKQTTSETTAEGILADAHAFVSAWNAVQG